MNQPLLQVLHPEQVEVEICRSEELDRRRGLTSELDEMWSYVRSKANPRWLWHAIDHHTGKVLIVRNLFAFDRIHVIRPICTQPFDFSVQYLLTDRKAPAGVSAA